MKTAMYIMCRQRAVTVKQSQMEAIATAIIREAGTNGIETRKMMMVGIGF